MQLHVITLSALFFIAKINCQNRNGANITNAPNNDPMEVMRNEIEDYKTLCQSSKEEGSNSRYSTRSYENNPRNFSKYNKFDRSYEPSGQGNYGYGSEFNRRPDLYAPPDLNYGYRRYKRSYNNKDNDENCFTQCVLGYLEVLDEDKSPSESAFIKWFRNNSPRGEKKNKAIREVRRCFGQLAASGLCRLVENDFSEQMNDIRHQVLAKMKSLKHALQTLQQKLTVVVRWNQPAQLMLMQRIRKQEKTSKITCKEDHKQPNKMKRDSKEATNSSES
ncbi:hypothetical protein FQA39_LY09332 [Lamprigera yunnana]|nr:hypothetical protein FQA39_LY09332 [Lamprigera yunnana]